MQPKRVKHSGVAFEYGDEQLIVPPLTVGQVEQLTPTLVEHDGIDAKDFNGVTARLVLRVKVISAALRRNYPELSDTEISEFVTGNNADLAFAAALGSDRTSPKTKNVGEN